MPQQHARCVIKAVTPGCEAFPAFSVAASNTALGGRSDSNLKGYGARPRLGGRFWRPKAVDQCLCVRACVCARTRVSVRARARARAGAHGEPLNAHVGSPFCRKNRGLVPISQDCDQMSPLAFCPSAPDFAKAEQAGCPSTRTNSVQSSRYQSDSGSECGTSVPVPSPGQFGWLERLRVGSAWGNNFARGGWATSFGMARGAGRSRAEVRRTLIRRARSAAA